MNQNYDPLNPSMLLWCDNVVCIWYFRLLKVIEKSDFVRFKFWLKLSFGVDTKLC